MTLLMLVNCPGNGVGDGLLATSTGAEAGAEAEAEAEAEARAGAGRLATGGMKTTGEPPILKNLKNVGSPM